VTDSRLEQKEQTKAMDLAYDHLQERGYAKKEGDEGTTDNAQPTQTQQNLNAEIQDAYKALANSPWASKIGGFFGNVVKQVRHALRGVRRVH
jgi:hypothetical protein